MAERLVPTTVAAEVPAVSGAEPPAESAANRGLDPRGDRGTAIAHLMGGGTAMSDFGRRLIVDADFDRTLIETMRAVQLEGLDILTRLDVREHLKRHANHECRRYVLLQVASPDLLLRALQTDIESGPFLPMSLAVYELADGETAVEATEPFAPVISDAAWRRGSPQLAALADKEGALLAKALSRIQHVKVRPGLLKIGD